mmetsp:Transcript_11908/g.14175  ORF Transcript_11908/g.14175 Transcript_11908/m.14175 type:complete len:238 (+) Transcript_11908:215-928(+)
MRGHVGGCGGGNSGGATRQALALTRTWISSDRDRVVVRMGAHNACEALARHKYTHVGGGFGGPREHSGVLGGICGSSLGILVGGPRGHLADPHWGSSATFGGASGGSSEAFVGPHRGSLGTLEGAVLIGGPQGHLWVPIGVNGTFVGPHWGVNGGSWGHLWVLISENKPVHQSSTSHGDRTPKGTFHGWNMWSKPPYDVHCVHGVHCTTSQGGDLNRSPTMSSLGVFIGDLFLSTCP